MLESDTLGAIILVVVVLAGSWLIIGLSRD